MNAPAPFWERPLATLDKAEWEALCDGCGQCCLHKVEDEDSGAVYATNVACRLLELQSCRCGDYRSRKRLVPDCLQLTPKTLPRYTWLPETCAYRRRAAGEPLPDWHYLVSGDREAVHRAGVSVRGRAVSEILAGPIEQHIVWPAGMAPQQIEAP